MTITQAQMTDFAQRRHAAESDHQIIQKQDDEWSADPVLTPARRVSVDSSTANEQTLPATSTVNDHTL